MQSSFWKITTTGQRTPVLRRRSGPRQKSANIVEEFLHQKSPIGRSNSPWQRGREMKAGLKRQTSLQPNSRDGGLGRRQVARSVDNIPLKEVESLQSDTPSQSSFAPALKHRYFVLSDATPIYDLKARALLKDVTDVEGLIAPSKEASREHYIRKIQMHLDVRLAQLKEDQKKMQITTFAPSTSSQDASQAFKSLRAGDAPTVMSLVLSDLSLLQAIDSTEQTLLHWACKRRMETLAMFLIDKGADIMRKDMGGRTSKDIARKKGMTMLVSYMQKIRPTFNPKMNSTLFMRKAARRMTGNVRKRKGRSAL